MSAKTQDHEDFIAGLKQQGIKNLVATQQRGLSIQMATYEKDGAGAETLTIGDLTDPGGTALSSMASTDYGVFVVATNDGQLAGGTVVDTVSFSIPAATFADTDPLVIVLVGQIDETPNP